MAGALDRPRPLPEAVRPLARLLAPGRSVTYTTGPRTRAALAAAGATAAATGPVVHLPRPPRVEPLDLGILAHELSHVGDRRQTPQRAELLSAGPAVDAGEQRARRVGNAVSEAARNAQRLPTDVAGLPVRAASANRERVLAAARAAAGEVVAAAPRPPSVPTAAPASGPAPAPVATGSSAAPGTGPGAHSGESNTHTLLPTASAARDAETQLSELIEAVEERVLLEIERRGGRWEGSF